MLLHFLSSYFFCTFVLFFGRKIVKRPVEYLMHNNFSVPFSAFMMHIYSYIKSSGKSTFMIHVAFFLLLLTCFSGEMFLLLIFVYQSRFFPCPRESDINLQNVCLFA